LFTAIVASAIGIPSDITTNINTVIHEDNSGALTLAYLEPGRVIPRFNTMQFDYIGFASSLMKRPKLLLLLQMIKRPTSLAKVLDPQNSNTIACLFVVGKPYLFEHLPI
jgi:hypothetical protein